MFEADGWPHQPCPSGEGDVAAPHRTVGEIRLAEARIGALAALQRTDNGRSDVPAELRLPDQVHVAELRPELEFLAAAAGAELAEASTDPTLFAVRGDQARVSAELERIRREQLEVGISPRRKRPKRGERASYWSRAAAKQAFGDT